MIRSGWGLILALLLLALPGAAHAQYFGQNKVQYTRYAWKSIESDHFEVYFYTGLDSLAMRTLDLAEKTSAVLSRRMGHSLGRRVPIILYGSHNAFAQTNVTPELIDAGTGGFTEVLRNRVVLPFTGSYEDLRHVVVHELTHAFMFDMLYSGSAAALIARQSFYSVPLWFAEGMAEYLSLGMESNAEIFLRDGTVEGYLPPLEYSGGYIVYKQGQSAVSYLCSRYGEDRMRDILRRTRQMRSFERAFERTMGMTPAKFDEQWRSWLRKQYWPTVATKSSPDEFARRLTDHRKDQSIVNTAPSISPQGDRIAFFSDRRQYTDVYILSALDGQVLNRVIRGERNVQFESIPSFRSTMTWSRTGTELALTAKSGGRDVLYVVDANDGKVRRRIEMPCDALYDPSWSPTSDSIVVAGVENGRSDLWLVEVSSGKATQLTNDTYDEKAPTWSPDGKTILFSSDRQAPVVLHPGRKERGFGGYGIYSMEIASRDVHPLIDTAGDDRSPAVSPDGRLVGFVSDYGGTPNIFLFDRSDSTVTQLTDVLGGIEGLSWSRQNDRLVFSAYNRGGYDVFAVREPLDAPGVLARLRRTTPASARQLAELKAAPPDSTHAATSRAALVPVWSDSLPPAAVAGASDSSALAVATPSGPPLATERDTLVLDRLETPPDPAWERGTTAQPFPALPDTVQPLATKIPLNDTGGPFALPDSLLGQSPSKYRPRLAPDYSGGGFYAASGYGFMGTMQFQFADFLGNHNLFVSTDIFANSLQETNALAIYSYLPRRWDYSLGVFHFKNYFDSPVSSVGESFGSARLFSERNYGALAGLTYPFDRFRRVTLGFTQTFLERQFFAEDGFGGVYQTGQEFRSVTSPYISYVMDNTLMGYYGPVNGQRYNLTFGPAIRAFPNALVYNTITYDGRRYWDLTHGYTFYTRMLGGYSSGKNPQSFRIGGFSTLRGYPDFELLATSLMMVTTELRFPFIQNLGFVGPLPLGGLNLKGVVFTDVGTVWNQGQTFRFWHTVDGVRTLYDPHRGPGTGLDFGAGIRTAMLFMIMKLDVAWPTNLNDVGRPRWHFSIGPEF